MVSKEKMIKKARSEYFRKYRLQNPEKVRQHMDNFWMRQAQAQALECRSMPDVEQQEDNNV